MKEQDIEDELITKLQDLKYVYRSDIRTRAALERINGVGDGKLARYGEAVLEVVRAFEA